VKKVLVAFLIIVSTLVFVGCGSVSTEKFARYPWTVVMVMKYSVEKDSMKESDIQALNTFLKDKHGEAFAISDEIVQIQLEFKDYTTFLGFFSVSGVDLSKVVKVVRQEKLFFIEDTIEYDNPWTTIGEHATIASINDQVQHKSVEYVYVLNISSRLTKAVGSYQHTDEISEHHYFFKDTVEKIVLFDRYENPPIWYAVGIGGTIVFMGAVYGIFTVIQRRKTVGQIISSDVI
jgi:hypothetical protein